MSYLQTEGDDCDTALNKQIVCLELNQAKYLGMRQRSIEIVREGREVCLGVTYRLQVTHKK